MDTEILKKRFEENMNRHPGISWEQIQKLIQEKNIEKEINYMEETGGEPDVMLYSDKLYYVDFSKETPEERRSLCYDEEALDKRKKNKPIGSVEGILKDTNMNLLDEKMYLFLQSLGDFDQKTSSWIETPSSIRILGGAIFGDKRYGRTFIYHNGADSYYRARGFRVYVKLGD